MLDSGGVYKILNVVNGECYIGSTATFQSRWGSHQRALEQNRHHSPRLQNSWNRYSKANFVFVLVEVLRDFTQLIKREQYWIDKCKPEYNWGPVAGSPLGVKRSVAYKRMLSKVMKEYYQEHEQAMKGKKHSPEFGLGQSKRFKGRSLKDRGHKNKCICTVCKQRRGEKCGNKAPHYGKKHSETTKEQIRQTLAKTRELQNA